MAEKLLDQDECVKVRIKGFGREPLDFTAIIATIEDLGEQVINLQGNRKKRMYEITMRMVLQD